MKTLANILWHIPFLGFVLAIIVWLVGLLLTITIVAAPIGRGMMEHGKFLFAPFSKSMVRTKDMKAQENPAWKAWSTVVTIVYIPIGILLAIFNIIQIVGLFASIIGIPFALPLARSLGTFLNPVGKKCVPLAVAAEMSKRADQAAIDKHLAEG